MKKSEFEEIKDELISCECDDCGASFDEQKYEVCEECGSGNLTNYTRNECLTCCDCGGLFEMWETLWEDKNDCSNILCEECYEKMED